MAPFMWTKCPACTVGRAEETRYRIQEVNRRVFYWMQNGEEEDVRDDESPYVFFCEDCEEETDTEEQKNAINIVPATSDECTDDHWDDRKQAEATSTVTKRKKKQSRFFFFFMGC